MTEYIQYGTLLFAYPASVLLRAGVLLVLGVKTDEPGSGRWGRPAAIASTTLSALAGAAARVIAEECGRASSRAETAASSTGESFPPLEATRLSDGHAVRR
jgi:hypothetical protein